MSRQINLKRRILSLFLCIAFAIPLIAGNLHEALRAEAAATTYLTDVGIVINSTANDAKKYPSCGYKHATADLNRGAGKDSKTIYLVFNRTTDKTKAVTHFITASVHKKTLTYQPLNFRQVYGNSIAWNAVSKATKYEIYRNDVRVGISTNTLYSFQDLTAGTTYTIGMCAVFADGSKSKMEQIKLTAVSILSKPTYLKRTGKQLSWNAVSGAVRYRVWVIDAETNKYLSSNAKVTGTSYTFNSLTAGKKYKLRVCAVDKNGNFGKHATTAVFTA